MNQRIRLKVSHRRPKPPTAAQHDKAYRDIGCKDVPRGDKERVPRKKRKRR